MRMFGKLYWVNGSCIGLSFERPRSVWGHEYFLSSQTHKTVFLGIKKSNFNQFKPQNCLVKLSPNS